MRLRILRNTSLSSIEMTLNIRDEVIWLTRGKNWGSRFLSSGPFSNDDALRVYDQIFSNSDEIPYAGRGSIVWNGKKEYRYFARRFYDEDKRDGAGRRIIHEIIAVSRSRDLRRGVDTRVFCSSVKEYYDGIFNIESEAVVTIGNTACVDFDVAEEDVENRDIVLNDENEKRLEGISNGGILTHRFYGLLILAIALAVGAVIALRMMVGSDGGRVVSSTQRLRQSARGDSSGAFSNQMYKCDAVDKGTTGR